MTSYPLDTSLGAATDPSGLGAEIFKPVNENSFIFLISALMALGLLVSCGSRSVIENEYVGKSQIEIINKLGIPNNIIKGYVAIPPWHKINKNVMETYFYKNDSGKIYIYLDDKMIVVESLYYSNNVKF